VRTGRRKKQNLNWLRIENINPRNAGVYVCNMNLSNHIIEQKCGELIVPRESFMYGNIMYIYGVFIIEVLLYSNAYVSGEGITFRACSVQE